MPRPYRKNLKALYVVHPTFWVKSFFYCLRPFVNKKFWNKVEYIDKLSTLDKRLGITDVVPGFVSKYGEKKLPVFGGNLVTACKDNPHTSVPVVIEVCVRYLRDFAMKTEGLFRVPGDSAVIKILQSAFEDGEDIIEVEDIEAVASVLKQYVRDLPEPLIPYSLRNKVLEAAKCFEDRNTEDALTKLQSVVDGLPTHNFNTLKYLLGFLVDVSLESDTNLMTIDNLSIVFTPNLLPDAKKGTLDDMMELFHSRTKLNTAVSLMLVNYNTLFCSLEETQPLDDFEILYDQ